MGGVGGWGGGEEVERGDIIRSENSPQLMGLANCQPPAFAAGSLEQVSKLVFYAHPTSAVISGLSLEQYALANCERKNIVFFVSSFQFKNISGRLISTSLRVYVVCVSLSRFGVFELDAPSLFTMWR